MEFFNIQSVFVIQDFAYLLLIASIWVTAMAIASPGTGWLEVVAAVLLIATIVAAVLLPINLIALLILLAGFAFLFLEIWKPLRGIFLMISIALFSVGSIFLFLGAQGEIRIVSWPLAVLTSAFTLLFFWFVIRKVLDTRRNPIQNDLSSLIGKIGETKTEVAGDSGMVQVASELWSARSEKHLPAGTKVKVLRREGLTVYVEKE